MSNLGDLVKATLDAIPSKRLGWAVAVFLLFAALSFAADLATAFGLPARAAVVDSLIIDFSEMRAIVEEHLRDEAMYREREAERQVRERERRNCVDDALFEFLRNPDVPINPNRCSGGN